MPGSGSALLVNFLCHRIAKDTANMRINKLSGSICAMLVAGVMSSVAVAQTGTRTQPSEPAGQSWIPYTSYGYVGGSVGRTNYDLAGCVPGFSCDDKATGLKLYTGGRFSRHFGVELGYVYLGEVD